MPKIAVIYASGLGRTKKMAEAIANGAMSIEGTEVLLKDAFEASPNDIVDADAIALGGSTYNYKLIKSIDPLLKEMAKLDLKGKVGVAFGSYGWSGESIPTLIAHMKSFGMNVVEPGTAAIQVPSKDDIEKCFHLGRTIATGLRS
ncbi:MAG: FprA family A-type flavoprotein [Methanothrix sp.]|uniref:flavodoxin domain-containing protein n=1 Tax=Methanothrix sp. TaxID=90426 RepID=UPI0025CC60E1|nr:flavodoxin domain-containing protein [Methanothrix sp.]MBK7386363.1 FprA family A-type flavoprotein [Methanothrix sp.]HPW72498.1 flavodoxin domain-containing protein [Methanothrix sp.]